MFVVSFQPRAYSSDVFICATRKLMPFVTTFSNIQDGCTAEVADEGGVRVLVAVRAKPNRDRNSRLNREFFGTFLDVSLSYLHFL